MIVRSVSASQVALFSTCQRKWFFRYIRKIRFPQTPAQARGTLIHKCIEIYLKTGKIPEHPSLRAYVTSAFKAEARDGTLVLPDPKKHGKTHLVEHRFELELPAKLPKWIGYIDVLKVKPAEIGDFKTTSNLRYAKTPTELMSDVQMTSYGKFAYTEGLEGAITLWHLVIEAKAKKNAEPVDVSDEEALADMLAPPKTKLPRYKYTPIQVAKDHVETCWQESVEVVNEMVKVAASAKSHHDVVPDTTRCGDYGGCEYRDECGIGDVPISAAALTRKKKQKQEQKKTMSSVLSRLKGTKKNGAVAAPDKPREMPAGLKAKVEKSKAKKAKEVPTGIVPEDAPENTTPIPEPEVEAKTEAPEKKTKKTRKSTKKATATEGFELYVDCMPTKRVDADDMPVMFEDFIAPIIANLNQSLEAQGIHSYLQLDYSNEKAAITQALANHLDEVPPTMIIMSSTLGAKEALNVFIPHARRVVKGLRG